MSWVRAVISSVVLAAAVYVILAAEWPEYVPVLMFILGYLLGITYPRRVRWIETGRWK